jgi:hypothetical protein
MLAAALTLIATAGCKKDSAAPEPTALPAEPTAAGDPAAGEPEAGDPVEAAATGEATATAEAASAGVPAKGGDLVAVSASGQAKVVATSRKVLADTATYTLSLAAPGRVASGAKGSATLEVVPKAGWKLNHEFPTKLSVTAPAGVAVARAEQTVKDAVAFGDKAGKWAIDFTPSSTGDKAFTGKIKFAVCTEKSCDPKKEELAWNVKVE